MTCMDRVTSSASNPRQNVSVFSGSMTGDGYRRKIQNKVRYVTRDVIILLCPHLSPTPQPWPPLSPFLLLSVKNPASLLDAAVEKGANPKTLFGSDRKLFRWKRHYGRSPDVCYIYEIVRSTILEIRTGMCDVMCFQPTNYLGRRAALMIGQNA